MGAGLGAELPAVGLRAEPVTLETCRGALIHLPAAERPGECVFVLMLTPPSMRPSAPADVSMRGRLAGALSGPPRPSSRPAVIGIWEQLRKQGAPVARCFALELVPDERNSELAPRIAEFSTVLGCVQTGYGALGSEEFVREVVERLDVY